MNAVDCSDQILATHNVNCKSMRWWKVLFFHLIDIAVVNSFLLFREHQSRFPDNAALKRAADYSLAHFREEIVRNICGFEEYMDPPAASKTVGDPNEFVTDHVPVMTEEKNNCVVCYKLHKKEKQVHTKCIASQCNKYMHITQTNHNCFQIFHTREYHR